MTVTSNLGGHGPDTSAPEEVRFEGAATTADGLTNLDFVQSHASSFYLPKNSNGNGLGWFPDAGWSR